MALPRSPSIRRAVRYLLRLALTGAVCVAMLLLAGGLLRRGLTVGTPEQIRELAQRRPPSPIDWTKIVRADDPSSFPSYHVEVDYAQGRSAAWYPRGESPILSELVKEGKLPPVEERVGPEPCVTRGPDGIGNYGGTWMRLANSPADAALVISWRLNTAGLVNWSPMGKPIVPHLAKRVEVLDDARVYVFQLRKGVRWSDGHPFTADDILYWWYDHTLNPKLGTGAPPAWMTVMGKAPIVEKLDDLTVRITFPVPNGTFLERLAVRSREAWSTPKHYLEKYNPTLGDPAFIEAERKALNLPSARALYGYVTAANNPECPRMWPWICKRWQTSPPYVYVRNPYYFAVDERGNQLPYIDRVQFTVQDEAVMSQSLANGYASMQERFVRFSAYTELVSRAGDVGQRILNWVPASRSVWTIYPNAQRYVPGNPQSLQQCTSDGQRELWWKRQLLADPRFRKALSAAIDRGQIIRAEFNNQCVPCQVDPGPLSPFHDPELAGAWIDHDPDLARRMLDEIGLNQRDVEGMRRFPDGSTMTFFLDYTAFTGMGPAQFVVDDWAKVGVRVIPRERARSLFYTQKATRDMDLAIWSSESDFFPLLEGRCFAATGQEANWGSGWGLWYQLGGLHGDPRATRGAGATEPPIGSPVRRGLELYDQASRAPTLPEQVALMREVMKIAREQLWTINICDAPPSLVVVSNNMKNVPQYALSCAVMNTPANTCLENYYFEKPADTAGTIADTRTQLEEGGELPRGAGATTGRRPTPAGGWVRWIIRLSIFAIVGLLVAMLVIRHPFVGRRLLIMVPTLFVISVIVFVIIQLPPGDYLTSRILELEESGNPQAQAQLEDLRTLFHFEDPAWKRYLRWTGILYFLPAGRGDDPASAGDGGNWFARRGMFQERNAGLLQGNLGRSMETSQLVSDMVGDRILLTIAISAGTILLTWAVAIPIGIYSAVRQYSPSDYFFTFVGFIGMSVPGFLLALVLGVLADVQGLFSPQFAAQTEWTWAKVADLLRHIWVPVAVLGVTGTAGMIRVMRANLLDELRKPYVTTARAKGVRPIKLLLKYPVRVALNPFISGIGGLFPQLVSGGAIVAIVLSLPTVGPLLLSALFSQDMYLAGSMLMVLSLLGVMGTLVSDVLLLWLDPRIRYE